MVESKVLCEVCHERPATHHVCEPHLESARDLCETCFEAQGIPGMEVWERRYQEALKTGRCRFCGGEAVAGCGGSLPFLGEQYQFWCEECGKDLEIYSRTAKAEVEESLPDLSVTEAGLKRTEAWLAEQERKLNEFMQDRIRLRGAEH